MSNFDTICEDDIETGSDIPDPLIMPVPEPVVIKGTGNMTV